MIVLEIINSDKGFIRLDEMKRLELVSMSRGNRYDSRSVKDIKYKCTNIDNIIGGKSKYLDITLLVGKHEVVIRFENFIDYLKNGIRKYTNDSDLPKAYLNMKPTIRKSAITTGVVNALDNAEVRVNCSCPDFKYRYSYKATVNNYNFGFVEDRAPEKTNPKLQGSTCKHLVGVLTATSKWQSKVIRDAMKAINWDSTILG